MITPTLRTIANNQFLQRHINKVVSNDIYAARILVGTSVAKDAASCILRFYQSINNQEIPLEKRKFVAALDLASGFVTCGVQMVMGIAISNEKLQTKITNKLFGHLKETSPELFKRSKTGFIAALALIGSGMIGERIIVPLIATPFASWIKNKYINKNQQESLNINNEANLHNESFDLYNKLKKKNISYIV
ncbi:MAG: hypothetical protein ACD_20C00084G0011 [uncultured bacterium]|nr:MAG: hypothetical protein ACD_20C00084G0011 [uncultured bacterium]HBH18410.1 hypothetical protein [Cyanobacteria bacterium UBA9579]